MTDDNVIEVRMESSNVNYVYYAYEERCDCCGHYFDLGDIVARNREHDIDVCPRCIRSGDVDASLRENMAAVEVAARAEIERLRGLIGRVKLPTWTEWCEADEEVVRQWSRGDEEAEWFEAEYAWVQARLKAAVANITL